MIKQKKKITLLKRKYFINENQKNAFFITILLVLVVALLLMTSTIFTYIHNLNFGEKISGNIQRVIQMILTGMALGISSYLLQRMTNNRLADTSIMGFGNFNLIPISILAICTNFTSQYVDGKLDIDTFKIIQPIIVVGFTIILCLIFNIMSKDKTKFNFKKLLLSGIILNFVSLAIAFSISSAGDYLAIQYIEKKAIGNIGGKPETFNLFFSMGCIVLGFIWIMLNSYKIQLIIQNQQIARQTGIYNISIMTQTMLCIGLLVGGSYALSGDFVFVGLIAGNIAFRFSRNKIYYGVPSSGLIGALMVLITYFVFGNLINVDNMIIAPLIPLLISPYFIYLVIRWR